MLLKSDKKALSNFKAAARMDSKSESSPSLKEARKLAKAIKIS